WQGHWDEEPAVPGLCRERGVAGIGPHRTGPAGVDAEALPHRRCTTLGTQTSPISAAPRCGSLGPKRTSCHSPPATLVALGARTSPRLQSASRATRNPLTPSVTRQSEVPIQRVRLVRETPHLSTTAGAPHSMTSPTSA